jgi:hypothetical protein
LFLLVAKTLYIATRAVVATSDLSDITFLDGIKQQTFLQYADDTSFLLAEVEPNIQTTTQLLHQFSLTTGLVYNSQKGWFNCSACNHPPSGYRFLAAK